MRFKLTKENFLTIANRLSLIIVLSGLFIIYYFFIQGYIDKWYNAALIILGMNVIGLAFFWMAELILASFFADRIYKREQKEK